MLFADLRLAEPILRAVVSEGYVTATPVQAQSIPFVLEGRDVLACAQTGTGKTAAFALPILHRLSHSPRAEGKPRSRCLVLAPTRELANQIAEGFRTYGKHLGLRQAVIFGGVNQNPQVDNLRRGVDIVVATPGRLLDLMNQGHVNLSGIEVLVLDEADRMLDMGFIHDIRKIAAQLPKKRQTLLFSATMPSEIRQLANSLLQSPAVVQIAPIAATTDLIEQSVYFVEKRNKPALLAHLVNALPMFRAIVFTRTKHGADRVVRHLHTRGIKAEAIHGNKTQNNRQRALDNFKKSKTPVLVATDIASRGIDVDDVTHVVNYDLTHEPETYVHRIGRTGRAGATGAAVSFCDRDEMSNLRAIERLIRRSIPVKTDHPVYESTPVSDDSRERRPHAASSARHPQAAAPARHPHPTARAATYPLAKPAAHAGHRIGQGAAPRPHHTGSAKPFNRRGPAPRRGGGR
jgi:ATP-dependent RNA helicase RhlE